MLPACLVILVSEIRVFFFFAKESVRNEQEHVTGDTLGKLDSINCWKGREILRAAVTSAGKSLKVTVL